MRLVLLGEPMWNKRTAGILALSCVLLILADPRVLLYEALLLTGPHKAKVWSLEKLSHHGGRGLWLIEQCLYDDGDDDLQRAAFLCLSDLARDGAPVLDLAIAMRQSNDRTLKLYSFDLLGKIQDSGAVAELSSAFLTDSDFAHRCVAGNYLFGRGRAAVPSILYALEFGELSTQKQALCLAFSINSFDWTREDFAAVAKTILEKCEHTNPEVRLLAVRALGYLEGDVAFVLPRLKSMISDVKPEHAEFQNSLRITIIRIEDPAHFDGPGGFRIR